MDQLRVSVRSGDSCTVVVLVGESDMYSNDRLRSALEAEASRAGGLLVVDLSGLQFMDSAAVQILFRIRAMLNERGARLVLASPQKTVARMLSLVGADQLIPVYGTVEEAADTRLG